MEIPASLKHWYTPAYMVIVDGRLSALSWFLRLCVAIYLGVSIWLFEQFQWVEQPGGYPTFWFGQDYKTQDARTPWTILPYCNGTTDYSYRYYEHAGYWNEDNINCAYMSYPEMVKVEAASAFITTYTKQEHIRAGDENCWTNIADGCTGVEEYLHGSRIVQNETCVCSKLQNSFATDAEKFTFTLEHAFSTSTELESIGGSSTYEEPPDSMRKTIRTCLKEPGDDPDCTVLDGIADHHWGKCCSQIFEPGETMTLTVKDWLKAGGVVLDERVDKQFGVHADVETGKYPFRRVTGQKLHLRMSYYGDKGSNMFKCEVDVLARSGWTSAGADAIFTNYVGLQSMNRSGNDLYTVYKRGVRFEFFPRGRVTKFHLPTLINTLISGLVLLNLVPHVVRVVANYGFKEESKVYNKAISKEFSYKKVLARFAVNSALACQAFKTWDTSKDEDTEPSISFKELLAVFKGSFDEETAAKFARVIFEEVHGAGTDDLRLTCNELVGLMSTGLVSLEQLREYACKVTERSNSLHLLQERSSRISPEPAGGTNASE
jgi:hypothetical protein